MILSIYPGNLLLLIKGYNLKPSGGVAGGTWEKTTRDRFREVARHEKSVRKWDETFSDITCVWGFISLLAIIGISVFILWKLNSNPATMNWTAVFGIDAAVLLIPHWVTGLRKSWRPVALRQQVEALEVALSLIDFLDDPPCQIQPMFEMAGEGQTRVPVGARTFIRFPDGPEDFLGLQFQVALNDVQGTKHPYLYAVLVARKSFGLLEGNRSKKIDSQLMGLTVESNSEEEVDVIVIRQHTTKTSGYHTKKRAIQTIAQGAWQSADTLLSAVPAG